MIEQYIKTDVGARKYNEDYAQVFTDGVIKGFVLCDGLGGCGFGDLASENVCKNFIAKFKESDGNTKERIDSAMKFCNVTLCNLQEKIGRPGTLRTTLCAVILEEELAHIVHCGDSRVYYFANGKYAWRTKDHSVSQLMALIGEIEESEIRKHVDRNKLLRAIGMGFEDFSYEIKKEPIKLCGDDAFLLCSDGFWEYINGLEMERLFASSKSVADWTELMFNQIKRRNLAENADNCTSITVRIKNKPILNKSNDEDVITLNPQDDETEAKTEIILKSTDIKTDFGAEKAVSSSTHLIFSPDIHKIILPTDIECVPMLYRKMSAVDRFEINTEKSVDDNNEATLKEPVSHDTDKLLSDTEIS